MQRPVRVGLVGSQFISTIHAEALRQCAGAELWAVASPTPGNAQRFAERHRVPHHLTDYRRMLEMDELDLIVVGAPNDLHCAITLDCAAAGKHVVVEKPLALNLAQADQMIEACRVAGVKLMYAEELCFAPKYVRLKELLVSGALGSPILLKQSEKHDGPHAGHFWDVERSGGGVAMDMGCHAIEFFRWMLDRPRISSVYAHMTTSVHVEKTRGDDNALLILEFENGVTALAEESWTKPGGMDDRAEVHGSGGVAYANLLQGNSILTYSSVGYDYAVEKAGSTQGWSFTMVEELWNYGFPQEFAHFVDCVANDKRPLVSGEDGRAVLETLFAAYASAGSERKISLPFHSDAAKPIDLWLDASQAKRAREQLAMTTSAEPDRRAIGIDIGGTKIAVAAVDGQGTIRASTELATEAELGFDRAIGRMAEAADRVLAEAGWARRELCGVGVGCAGPVSAERGVINNPYTLPTWIECDIVGRLRAIFDLPAYLENDADAAALGETFAGSARGCSRMVMLTFGTGVGGGAVIDGRVYRGTLGEHPELGHIPVDRSGPACYCGTSGCLESIASGSAIAAAGKSAGFADSREVFLQAARGNPAARTIVERVERALQSASWTILHTFMPELIVLGGGVMDEHYELLAPAVADQLPLATMVPPGGTRVVKAGLSNRAGLVGAASLALLSERD